MSRGCDIYVVGAANVGKSSFMNRLFNAEGGSADVRGKALSKKGQQQRSKKRQGLTTSPLPGTTLSFVKLNIGDNVALYDTPGLILPHQLTSKLSTDDLKVVIPQRKLDVVRGGGGGGGTGNPGRIVLRP